MSPKADPYRCERCLVFWAPEAAASALWHHGGFLVCTNRAECDRRVAFAHQFTALLNEPPYGPLDPASLAPVLILQLPPRLPRERR